MAAADCDEALSHELGKDAVQLGEGLFVAPGPPRAAAWAQNVWLDSRVLPVRSIAEAARSLRTIQRMWVLHPVAHVRRSRLIEAALPKSALLPIRFPAPPRGPWGAFALVDRDRMIASPATTSPFPGGRAAFAEDREGPPSRAYLKLWEALTLLGAHPARGERCVDLGSSPGGWTWAAARLGADVVSVDKASLDPRVASLPGVRFVRASAFAIDPRELGPVDWLFCDVVCYPKRLLAMIERWLDAGAARRMVCTLKFQGATDHATARRFASIDGSRLVHLWHNKHELTWMWAAPSDRS